jgi:hypothetical protein
MSNDGVQIVRFLTLVFFCGVLALAPSGVNAFDFEESSRANPDIRIAQNNGGKSLSEAVEQVRRQTDGKILSAETRVSGNREVHHIKVLTKDGKVKTHKVQGRRRGG